MYTTFILDHTHFTPCHSEPVLLSCESHFYDVPSTSLWDLTLSAKTVAFVEITCQTFAHTQLHFSTKKHEIFLL